MRTKKGTAARELGEAEVLEEAADKKLQAARKMARANAMLQTDPDPGPQGTDGGPEGAAGFLTDPDPAPMAEPSKMDLILEKIGGEGKVEISRMVAGQWSKCGVYPIEDFPDILETLAIKKNGGTFKTVFKDRGGLIRGQDTQTFDAETYGSMRKEDSVQSDALSFMKDQLVAQQREITTLRSEQMTMLLKMMESSQARQSHTASELSELMKVSRDMNPPPKSPFESMKEVLEMVAIFRTDGVVGEPPDPLTLAIDKGLRILEPLLGAWAAKLAQQGTEVPSASSGAAGGLALQPQAGQRALPPPAAAPAPSLPAAQGMDPGVVKYAQSLYQFASQGASFKAVAESILTLATSDEDLNQLDTLVSDPGLVAQLLKAEPRLLDHQGWLASLMAHLQSELKEMEDQGPAPEPAQQPETTPVDPLDAPFKPRVAASKEVAGV